MSAAGALTEFGRVLHELIKRSAFATLGELVKASKQAGYPISGDDLNWAMHHQAFPSPCDLNLVRGPAEVLGLGKEERKILAEAYVFDETIGPRAGKP